MKRKKEKNKEITDLKALQAAACIGTMNQP